MRKSSGKPDLQPHLSDTSIDFQSASLMYSLLLLALPSQLGISPCHSLADDVEIQSQRAILATCDISDI